MNNVLLFGASGFIGTSISKSLEKNDINWKGVSRSLNCGNIQKISLSETSKLQQLINEYPIIINAMGASKPIDFEQNTKEVLNNFLYRLNLFKNLIVNSNVKKVINISSGGTVYGESTNLPSMEDDDLNPISWYGRAKEIEELELQQACSLNDINYLCVRVTNPYGNPYKSNHGFVDVLINSVKLGTPFSFYADKNPIRDFIYAEDMADALTSLIKLNKTGIFNIGSGNSLRLTDIVDYISKNIQNTSNVSRKGNIPPYDVEKSIVSIDKLKNSNAYRETKSIFEYIDEKLKEHDYV